MKTQINSLLKHKNVPLYVAALGLLLFYFQLAYQAIHQYSSLDEGMYLLKGLWFVTGKYIPYQEFGPLTNHMPLSFLIPGVLQNWFGPSLQVARYFSIGFALLGLVGVWLAATRLAGKWPAVLAVWMVAINPAFAKFYVQATTQVLVFLLLAWILAFSVNPNKSKVELYSSVVLSGILFLTRINMLPVIIVLLLYILWTQDQKTGFISIASGLVVLGWGYSIWPWPEMLNFWAMADLIKIIQSYSLSLVFIILIIFTIIWNKDKWSKYHNITIKSLHTLFTWLMIAIIIYLISKEILNQNFISTTQSLFYGYRSHFFSIIGVFAAYLIFSKKPFDNKTPPDLPFLYLSTLFLVLLVPHIWKSIGLDSCRFCFEPYLAFFSQIGIILLVYALKNFSLTPSKLKLSFYIILIGVSFAGLGFAANPDIQDWVTNIQVPRISGGQILPGTTDIWRLLVNRFGWEYNNTSFILSSLVGLLSGILFLALILSLHKTLAKKYNLKVLFEKSTLLSLVFFGFLFSPSIYLGNGYRNFNCQGNILSFYETTSEDLTSIFENETQIFWWYGSPAPLIKVPNAQIHPEQLNAKFNYFPEENALESLKKSGWNEELGRQWANEADYLLTKPSFITGWLDGIIDQNYTEVKRFTHPEPCTLDRTLILFKNNQ